LRFRDKTSAHGNDKFLPLKPLKISLLFQRSLVDEARSPRSLLEFAALAAAKPDVLQKKNLLKDC